jgi:K+/H+ antiporter YhaU regulatory subunit KhtT
VLSPTPDDTIEVGDELLFVATVAAEPQLKELLAPSQ